MPIEETRLLSVCSLGLGFSRKGFEAGLERAPHAIACDAGSSDFGPYYLGTGELQKSLRTVGRDLELLIEGAQRIGVPFFTGSVGGAGAGPQVDATADFVRGLARDRGMSFRLATIKADVSKDWLKSKIAEGKMRSVGDIPDLTPEDVDRLVNVVAMMGEAPFLKAREEGAEVILSGRATDPAILVAEPLRRGVPSGIAWHAAKSLDKGYLATTRPQDGSPVLARMSETDFVLEPTREGAVCSVHSVASLTLHENPNPFEVVQPTGTIDTHQSSYEEIGDGRLRVTGSRYLPHEPTLKIEGARFVGYRTLLIAGIRDPRLIDRLDEFLDTYRGLLARAARAMNIAEEDYRLNFRVYGRDAVLGQYEPQPQGHHEVGLIVDLVGRTEEISGGLGSRLGATGSRLDILSKLNGGGNFAYPFSPSLLKAGPVYEWGAWHIAEVDAAELDDLFPIRYEDL